MRACRNRDYNEEGIAMFLLLERVGGPELPAAPSAESARLARLAEHYLARLGEGSERPAAEDLASALELLAAHHFEPR